MEAEQVDAGCCLVGDSYLVAADGDGFARGGQRPVVVEQIAGDGVVVVALRHVEVETLVDVVDFHASAELICRIVDLPCGELVVVVLVFDFAEDFFHEVFEGDHAAGAAELVEHDGERPFLLEQLRHHLACQQCFWGEDDGLEARFPVGLDDKQLADLNEADELRF